MDNLSSLQDALWASVRRNLCTFTPHFERIIMSTDASENPAELYGDDGKIYYRKAGGAGAEIGTGGGGLWSSDAVAAWLTTPKVINLKGYPLYGSDVSGANLTLIANSVDAGKIQCNDMLDLSGNDIVNVNDFCGKDDDDLIFYGVNTAGTGTNEFMRWKQVGQVLQMNNNIGLAGNDINLDDGDLLRVDAITSYDGGGVRIVDDGTNTRLKLAYYNSTLGEERAFKCYAHGTMNGFGVTAVEFIDFDARATAPAGRTVGAVYVDSVAGKLKLLVSVSPDVWETVTSA